MDTPRATPIASTPLGARAIFEGLGDVEEDYSRLAVERHAQAVRQARKQHEAFLKITERETEQIRQEQRERQAEVEELERKRRQLMEEVKDLEIKTEKKRVPDSPIPREQKASDSIHTRHNPATMMAVQPLPYTGKEPWRQWFRHFSEDMDLNGWGEVERLFSLKRALRNGPGEEALILFEEGLDHSYDCLARLATRICGKITPENAVLKYKSRIQKRDEPLRLYALDLKKLAMETYTNVSTEVAWLRDEINGHFVEGIRDPELREVVRTGWRSRMTIDDLCDLGEYHAHKKLYTTGTTTVSTANSLVESIVIPKQEEVKTPEKASESPDNWETTVETIVTKILEAQRKNRKNRPKLPLKDRICHRCQQKGHLARTCPALVPIPGWEAPKEN